MDNILEKIRSGKIAEAINDLIVRYKNTAHEKELIIYSARYISNQRNRRIDVIDLATYTQIENKIIASVLSLIEIIKAENEKRITAVLENKSRKILFCESNPFPSRNLFSNVELREIDLILNEVSASFSLLVKPGLTLELFTQFVNKSRTPIIHFSAYSDAEGIYFHDKADKPEHVGNQNFKLHFEMVNDHVECLFFNTFVAEKLAKSLSESNVFVIGFNDIIEIFGAIEFATGFYTAMGYGKNYRTAFEIGKQTLLSSQYKNEVNKLYAYYGNEIV